MYLKAIFLLIVLCTGAAMTAETTPNPNDRALPISGTKSVALVATNTVESLAADLQDGNARTRINAVRRLGTLPDPESKRILVDRFKKMPPPEPTTDSDQAEKLEVLHAVLPKLQPSERTLFLLNTLHEEISAMKAAKQIERDRFYPKNLAYFAVASLEKIGLSDELRDELATFSTAPSVPQSAREEFLAAVLRHDMEKEGIHNIREKARSAIRNIGIRPVAPIPWETYNDQQKRIAYSKTEVFRDRQKKMAMWLKSDEAIRTAAYEKVLDSFGLPAIEELVLILDQELISRDRRDYLALLASKILRTQSAESSALPGNLAALVETLTKYVEGMEDDGAFGRRAIAAANLNTFCEKTGLSKRIAITPAERTSIGATSQHPTK